MAECERKATSGNSNRSRSNLDLAGSYVARESRRIAVGAVVLAAALGVSVVWWRGRSPVVTEPRSAVVARPAAVMREAPVVPAPVALSQSAATGAKTPVAGSTEFDMCGLGKVAVDSADIFAPYRYLNHAVHKTSERWLVSLLISDDMRARAAGLLMQGKVGQDELAGHPMEEQVRDELVALAVGAGDPAVYALALSACGAYSTSAGGTCQQLSVAAWARLDPDNVWPWLVLAGPSARSQRRIRRVRCLRSSGEGSQG